MTLSGLRSILGLASACLFLWLIWISNTYLSPGKYSLFDGSAGGYDFDYAQGYLKALGDTGTDTYLGLYRIVDTVFPLVFTTFLAFMTLAATEGFRPVGRILLMVPPGAYLVMDLAENALVAGLLKAGPDGIDAAQVALASQFTMTKYAVLMATVLGLAALKLMGRRA